MKRQRASLGELCSLVKGTSPISKTLPGPYPLVTTGEAHKTADSFQFDAEAVCVPLISSTGHGHASLKRVHYQSGKFALANLLAAALVKDPSVLSPKFLMRYLMFSKDRFIVPLMTGAANMSISLDRLATVPVDFPLLAEQERVVRLLDEADELRKLRAQADGRTDHLIPAIYHKMFGDPASNGTHWQTVPLGDMGKISTGNTPSRKNPEYYGNFVEWIKTDNIDATNGIITAAVEGLSEKGAEIGRVVPSGAILITCIAGSRDRLGDAAVTDRQVAINQQINSLTPNRDIDSYFLCQTVMAMKKVIQHRATGAMTGIINKSTLESIPAICPPLPLQKEFAQQVAEIRELEATQAASRQRLEALFQSLLHRAFQGD